MPETTDDSDQAESASSNQSVTFGDGKLYAVDRSTAGAFDDVYQSATEPGIPDRVDHETRRQTRLASTLRDVDSLPSIYVECGCGDCPEAADPLADESEAFRDVSMAADVCPSPRPMTVERAAEAYYTYKISKVLDDEKSTPLSRTKRQHGKYMEGERRLLDNWSGDVSTALLSLRVSPTIPITDTVDQPPEGVEDDAYYGKKWTDSENGGDVSRLWVHPLALVDSLKVPWGAVKGRLGRSLSGFGGYEYVWVVSCTRRAVTPHLHLYVYVNDPEDELSSEYFEGVVDSFVSNMPGADADAHPVEPGESDTVSVETTPLSADVSDGQALDVMRFDESRKDEGFQNTAGMQYVLNQRPHWVLERLVNGVVLRNEEREGLEAGAIANASSMNWIGSSRGFPKP